MSETRPFSSNHPRTLVCWDAIKPESWEVAIYFEPPATLGPLNPGILEPCPS